MHTKIGTKPPLATASTRGRDFFRRKGFALEVLLNKGIVGFGRQFHETALGLHHFTFKFSRNVFGLQDIDYTATIR